MLFYSSSSAVRPKGCLRAFNSNRSVPRTNGRNKAGAASIAEQARTGPAAAGPGSRRSSSSSSSPASWSQRMASIQDLMTKVQQQLQRHTQLVDQDPGLAQQLKVKAEQHLDLLMQLAEIAQRQITGDMQPEQLQQVLRSLQKQLEQQQDEVLAAIQQQPTSPPATDSGTGADSNTSSRQPTQPEGAYLKEHNRLLGATAEIHSAIQQASAELSRKQQGLHQLQYTSDTAQGRPDPQDAQTTVEAAESAIQNTQDLLRDYDQMCQRAFQLSRKLSQAEADNVELKGKLSDVKAAHAATAEELAEHQELQMQYDKLCQDMYRLRMMLQQAQAAGGEVAAQAAGSANEYKRDMSWLMEAHRAELAEEHRKNQFLTQHTQELRMRLLEVEQQLWGQNVAGSAPAATPQQSPEAEARAQATDLSEAQQLDLVQQLQDAVQQLTQDKQQLMKNLQDMQREQAVLLMELQGLQQEQKQQTAAASDSPSGTAAASAVEEAAAEGTAEAALQQQLQKAEHHRSTLIEQVQELQHSLQEAREAAASAVVAQEQSSSVVTPMMTGSTSRLDAAVVVAAERQLTEMKTRIVQLKGQLAETRRELHHVAGRVAAAEAALQQQAVYHEARLQQLQTLYSKQTAVVAQLRKGNAPTANTVGFSNTNRFWVRQELLFEFLKHWVVREGLMQQQDGFLGLQVQPVTGVTADGGVDVIVTSLWETIPQWEAWSKCDAARHQHMPVGVYQYVPEKGKGFPEDFVPFRDYDDAVNAKY